MPKRAWVLLSFHVEKGKNYVTDLKPSDIVLLEDGKPRGFTIFDSAATQGRMPLELVLLFDANRAIESLWDPAAVYRFIPQSDLARSQALLAKESADIRISVYRCSGQILYRSTAATTDPQKILFAFHQLSTPGFLPQPEGTVAIPLTLPTRRKDVPPGPFTNDYVTSYFVSSEQRGWPMEAAIGVLDDVSAAADKVARLLVMFSEGIGATTTIPEDVGNYALDLGIPIYPVATNYERRITVDRFPRNRFRMDQFESLGKTTGGRSVEYPAMDAALLLKILENVKAHGLAEYVVGFVPESNGAPREHKLQMKFAGRPAGSAEGGMRRAVY